MTAFQDHFRIQPHTPDRGVCYHHLKYESEMALDYVLPIGVFMLIVGALYLYSVKPAEPTLLPVSKS